MTNAELIVIIAGVRLASRLREAVHVTDTNVWLDRETDLAAECPGRSSCCRQGDRKGFDGRDRNRGRA